MRRYATIMAVLAAVTALLGPFRETVVAAPPERPQLQGALDAVVAAGAPGVLGLVHDQEGTWAGASGLANLDDGSDMTPDLRFRIASVTKPFVATVALQLVAERRLSLDDTVEGWLPGIVPGGQQITVRQLLAHTSGVPDYVEPLVLRLLTSAEFRRRTWEPAELVAYGTSRPPTFSPGTAWSYSNTGYLLLGMIVEEVTGAPISEEIEQRLLDPLGLDTTAFPVDDPRIGGDHAHGYELALDPEGTPLGEPLDYTELDPSIAGAAGAMVSTAEDLADFQRALLGGALLPPELLAEMKTPVAGSPPELPYGLGVGWLATSCGRLVGHTGGIFGFSTFAFSSEDGHRQAIMMVNVGVFMPPTLAGPIEVAFLTLACGGPPGSDALEIGRRLPMPDALTRPTS
jgi:D-alanyl-D-alanine carboxypeptidase